MEEAQKLFFSYSRIDGEKFALQLATDLRSAGCNVWIDQLDIRPGKPWDLEIENALASSTCLLFVVTEKSTASKNTLDEVYYAIDNNKEVIPVIFGNCQVPFRLKRLQHIDFTANYGNAFNRLLAALKAADQPGTIENKNVLTTSSNIYSNGNPNEKKSTGQIQEHQTQTAGNKKPILAISAVVALAIIFLAFYLFTHQNNPPGKEATNVTVYDTAIKSNDSELIKPSPGKNGGQTDNASKPVNPDGATDAVKTPGKSASPSPTDQQPIVDTSYYRLQLQNGEMFLDAAYCGNNVVLNKSSDFADGACQLWRLVPAGRGWFGLQIKNGGKYLKVDDNSGAIILIPASEFDATSSYQLWRLVANGDGWNRLQIQYNKTYLDADHCSTKLVLNPGSDFAAGACQLWKLVQ